MPTESFSIGPRKIGAGERPFIIAEVAQAHEGSINIAHSFIDAAAGAGADAIKFQTHIAAAESTPDEPWRKPFGYKKETRYQYWQRMEFSPEEWAGLKRHCDEAGVEFLSSPFSIEAADLLEKVGIRAWKLGSGELLNLPLVDRLAKTAKPLILSNGLIQDDELDRVVSRVGDRGVPFALLQCTTAYPSPPEQIYLREIPRLAERYRAPVGLSDHSGTIYPSLGAVALGASILEVHICFSRQMAGPDAPASITIEELAELRRGADVICEASRHDRSPGDHENEMRRIFQKSIYAAKDIEAGTALNPSVLTYRKPLAGIPAFDYEQALGKRTRRSIASGEPIRWEDLE